MIIEPRFAELERAGQKGLNARLKIAADVVFAAVNAQMPQGDVATEALLHSDDRMQMLSPSNGADWVGILSGLG